MVSGLSPIFHAINIPSLKSCTVALRDAPLGRLTSSKIDDGEVFAVRMADGPPEDNFLDYTELREVLPKYAVIHVLIQVRDVHPTLVILLATL